MMIAWVSSSLAQLRRIECWIKHVALTYTHTLANEIEEYSRDELAFHLCIHLEAIKVKKKEQTIYVWTNKCDYEKVSVQREDTLENVDSRCV